MSNSSHSISCCFECRPQKNGPVKRSVREKSPKKHKTMITTKKNQTKITAEPGKQEVVITREFEAPRELVFKAFTDPKLIPQWWGPRYLSTRVDKMDLRPGGQWRFINQDAEGKEYAFHGVYHEVRAPERVIDTF